MIVIQGISISFAKVCSNKLTSNLYGFQQQIYFSSLSCLRFCPMLSSLYTQADRASSVWVNASLVIVEREKGKASTDSENFYLKMTLTTSACISLDRASHISKSGFNRMGLFNTPIERGSR